MIRSFTSVVESKEKARSRNIKIVTEEIMLNLCSNHPLREENGRKKKAYCCGKNKIGGNAMRLQFSSSFSSGNDLGK